MLDILIVEDNKELTEDLYDTKEKREEALLGITRNVKEIKRYVEEDCRLIHIENSGCSLKEEELPNLFDSFYRCSNSNGMKGNGLGLYIFKILMRKMDGEIFAQINEESFAVTVVVRKA